MDGTLQSLFLTPRTESEIAAGKLGPYLAKGALRLLCYAPTWGMGLLFSFYARQPLLICAFTIAPIFAVSFALRTLTVAHWVALSRRKVGVGFVPLRIAVTALVLLPGELVVIGMANEVGALALLGVCLTLTLTHIFESLLMFHLGTRALRRWRVRGAPIAN